MNEWIRKFLGVGVVLMFMALVGCADHRESYHREVVETAPNAGTSTTAGQSVVVEKHAEHVDHAPHGVFDIVGEILAFPFQLIADVFRFVF